MNDVHRQLDIVYLFRHSKHQDQEIRYSLRSVAENLPFIHKVWVFGDRPDFLADDSSLIEHIPHEYIAPLLGLKIPVRSDFLMLFLASLLPAVSFEFVRFSDDYIILAPLLRAKLTTARALEDLTKLHSRGRGKWKDMLWRTYDMLRQYGYAGHSFESHVPQPFNKTWAFEAFMAFREFLSERRYQCLLTGTTIYNYALKHHGLEFVWIKEE